MNYKENQKRVDELIKLPGKVTLEDGREIQVTLWEPCADVGGFVRVRIEGYVVRDGKPEMFFPKEDDG